MRVSKLISTNKLIYYTIYLISSISFANTEQNSEDLYQQNCAACHGADRLGLIGPALLPQNLKRLRKNAAIATITAGRLATQIPPDRKSVV